MDGRKGTTYERPFRNGMLMCTSLRTYQPQMGSSNAKPSRPPSENNRMKKTNSPRGVDAVMRCISYPWDNFAADSCSLGNRKLLASRQIQHSCTSWGIFVRLTSDRSFLCGYRNNQASKTRVNIGIQKCLPNGGRRHTRFWVTWSLHTTDISALNWSATNVSPSVTINEIHKSLGRQLSGNLRNARE